MTRDEILRILKEDYKAVCEELARHPEDGGKDRYETYEEYDDALNVAMESLTGGVRVILEAICENREYQED